MFQEPETYFLKHSSMTGMTLISSNPLNFTKQFFLEKDIEFWELY